jgi:hypothetical protein
MRDTGDGVSTVNYQTDPSVDADPETINAAALTAVVRQVIANNRTGGWRRLRREGLPNA